MRLDAAGIIIKTLADLGVSTVFGYPGGWVLDVYDKLYRSRRIRHILTCHEQAAAHAADGYARTTGQTGVVLATSGPGATNLVTGIAAAYMDSVPMLAITCGVPESVYGRDNFQEVDFYGMTMPITKHNFVVMDINELEGTLVRAFRLSREGRPGPVSVDIHVTMAGRLTYRGLAALRDNRGYIDPGLITKCNEAAELINAAERPIICAGGGACGKKAVELVREISRRYGIPVCTTSRGIGVADSDSPLSPGLLGVYGAEAANAAVGRCDLFIGVGMRFSDRSVQKTGALREGCKIIHIDIDKAEIGKIFTPDVGIAADSGQVLEQLLGLLEVKDRRKWSDEVAALCAAKAGRDGDSPEAVFAALQAAMPNARIVTDVGQHQVWVWQHCRFGSPDLLLSSCGLGAMGFGAGAAIGAAVSDPGTDVVLVTGDGSFHMNMNELATMVSLRLPIVVLVLDNRTLGLVRQIQDRRFSGRHSETETARKTDYVKLAKAMGALGLRLDRRGGLAGQIGQAAALAKKRRLPMVMHCPVPSEWRAAEAVEMDTTIGI